MNFAFATMPRSGSEFVVRLVCTLLGPSKPEEILAITPARALNRPGSESQLLRTAIRSGDGMDFFRRYSPQCIKLEGPSTDGLVAELSALYPRLKWVTSIRAVDKIITSHHNIKSWGWSEQRIIEAFRSDLDVYEALARDGRLFVVNVDAPEHFNIERALAFLGCEQKGPLADQFVQEWRVINPLERQQRKAGEATLPKQPAPGLDTLRQRHPSLHELEERYEHLWMHNR